MKRGMLVVLGLVLAVTVFGQAIPPINLQAQLLPGGEVSLTWEPPPDGLFEDFEDGVADEWDYYPDVGVWSVEDGYLKCANWNDWKSAWYTGLDFDDFTLEGEFVNHVSSNSRGLQFRCSGAQEVGTGYSFYVAYNVVNYAVYRFSGGSLTLIHGWTPSNLINTGEGESNRLKVVGQGSTFDLYINDTYVSSFTDATYPTGMVGTVASSQVEAWYDQISCLYGAVQQPEERVFHPVEGVECDEFGVPVDQTRQQSLRGHQAGPRVAKLVGADQPRAQQNVRDLDEFVEYRIYRDGEFIGTADLESYTDQLPSLGEHEYTVTAWYDPEGESSPAGPVTVNWEAVLFDLTGQVTQIPANGGTLVYDASLENTTAGSWSGVDYWTAIQMPNGQVFSPVDRINNFNVTPFMNITVTGLDQAIPDIAPEGNYIFTGHIGFYPNSFLSASFGFTKLAGPAMDGLLVFDPQQWRAGGDWSALLAGSDPDNGVAGLPGEYALSAAWPNPFNASTSFTVTLPETSELTANVYNLRGQVVATLASGRFAAGSHQFTFAAEGLASGVYILRAIVPGQLAETRKLTLLK